MQYTEQQVQDLNRVQAVNGEHPGTTTALLVMFILPFAVLFTMVLSGVDSVLLQVGLIALVPALIIVALLIHIVRYASANPARRRLGDAGVTLRGERLRLRKEIRSALPSNYGRLEARRIALSLTSNGPGSRDSTSDGLHSFVLDSGRKLVHMVPTAVA